MVMNTAQTFLAIMAVYPFSDLGTAIQFLQLAINYHAALWQGTLASLPGAPSVMGTREGRACSVLLPGKTLGPTQTPQCQMGSGRPQHKPASEGAGRLWPELTGSGDLRVPLGRPRDCPFRTRFCPPMGEARVALSDNRSGGEGQMGPVGGFAAAGLSGATSWHVCQPGLPGGV